VGFLAAGGGVKGETKQTATGGNADVGAATGSRNYNIGGNPNVASALQSPTFVVGVLIALVVAVYLWKRK
jgi:hypothetical protein